MRIHIRKILTPIHYIFLRFWVWTLLVNNLYLNRVWLGQIKTASIFLESYTSKEDAVMTLNVLKSILAALFSLGVALYAAAASADVDYDNADTGSATIFTQAEFFAGDGAFREPE